MKKAHCTFKTVFPCRLLRFLLFVLWAARLSGTNHGAEIAKGSPIWFGDYPTAGLPLDATNLVDLVSQQGHTIALRENGEVIGWGEGLGGAAQIPAGLPPVKKIAAGYYFGMALLYDGTVRVWGAGGHVSGLAIVTPPTSATNLVEIAAGMAHCVGVRADGTVIAWGNGIFDALAAPASLTNAVWAAAGQAYSVGVTSARKVIAWGNLGPYKHTTLPGGLNNPAQISVSPFDFSLGLNADGRVYGWGDNSQGQITAAGVTNAFAVAAGSQHSLVAYGDGLLKAYGNNSFGQGRTPANFPKVFKIAAGERHSVALTRAPVIIGLKDFTGQALAGDDAPLRAMVLAAEAFQAQWHLNGTPIPGATSPDFFVTNIQTGSSGQYELVVSNRFGLTRTGPLQFTVQDAALHWALQPTHLAVRPGATAAFSAEARGTDPTGYQWYHDGNMVPGGATNRLVFDSVTLADEGVYWVLATNPYSIIKSAEVRLVAGRPAFLQQPQNQRARAGWNLQLEAEILSPSTISCQWFHNGEAMEGETEARLSIASVSAQTAGVYRLRVRNDAGEVWSREATVELLPEGWPERPAGIGVIWGNSFFDETGGAERAVDLTQTAVGQGWLAGLHGDGRVETWGDSGAFKPLLEHATNVVAISAGLQHIIGVRRDGTTVGIGQALPADLQQVAALSAGENSSLFAKRDGTIVAVDAAQPAGLSNVVAVAAGNQDHMAVLADGRVYCWSRWGYFPPYYAVGITNAIAAAGGEYNSMALLANGTVATWGRTFQGPERAAIIPGVSNVVEIAYYRFALARLASGEIVKIAGSDGGPVPYGLRATTLAASIGLGSATSVIPFFDTHPVPLQVYEHGATKMTVKVRGPGVLSFQWLQDNVPVPGATNATLEITDAAVRQTGLYKVRAANGNGAVESPAAKITVFGKPEITVQTELVEVLAGRAADLKVDSVSALPVRFQWEFNGLPIPGASTNSLTIANAQSGQAGSYQLILANDFGITTSAPIQVTVLPAAPTFTTEPANQVARDGETAEFKAAAIGTSPITWQWFHENMALPGATNATLTINQVQAKEAGEYYVVAQNPAGAKASAAVTLARTAAAPSVQITPPFRLARPGRANRFEATLLAGTDTGGFSWQWKYNGADLAAETNAWLLATNTGTYSVEVKNAIGAVESPGAQLRVLPGRIAGVVRTWGGRASVRTPDGLIAEEATQGLNFGAALRPEGQIALWGTAPGGTNPPPSFNEIVSLAAGDGVLFGLRNDGRVLVLQSSGVTDFGESATNIVSLSAGSAHALALRADGTLVGWGPTNLATIPVAATNVVFFDAAGGRSVALRADGGVVNWGSGVTAALANTPAAVSNVVALAATTTQNAALRSDGSVVVWGGTATPTGNSNIVRLVSGQAHFIGLRNDGSVTLWGSNTDGQTTKPADITNMVAVTAGLLSSHAIVATPRLFTANSPQTVALGSAFTLRSFAVGAGTLTYQWQLNNLPLAGQNSSNLTLTATATSGGNYSLVVSNEWTSVRSGNYAVSLGLPPTIATPPVSQILLVGQPAAFSVEAAGSPTLVYQWMRNGIPLVGATSRTLALPNVFSIDDGAWTVRVSNSFGSIESAPAHLTVGQYPIAGPTLQGLTFDLTELSLRAAVEPGAFYRLQTSTNLLFWEELKTFVPTGNLFNFVSPSPTNDQRFYRLVTP